MQRLRRTHHPNRGRLGRMVGWRRCRWGHCAERFEASSSPRDWPGTKSKSYACQYDSLREFRTDRSIVEGLSLERFMGPDGLMLAVITNRMPRNARGRHNG